MKKPIIGITGSIMIDNGGMFPGYERAYVNNDYIEAVIAAGGIPYIIPMNTNKEITVEQIENVDAVLLSGGQDVNPLLYGEEPVRELGAILPRRDTFDFTVIETAMKLKKPILGVCRGLQILNVANGGSLNQDLKYAEGCYIKHNQGHSPALGTHTVNIEKDSKLAKIIGENAITNSFHHQTIKVVADGFKAVAFTKDGSVEAIEKIGDEFIIALQWHPEMMAKTNENMRNVFTSFIEAAKKSRD